MSHEDEELQKQEELEKERYERYLAEETVIIESKRSNDVEINRTTRYFSGVILLLLSVYIKWDPNQKLYIVLSYGPFVLAIITNIICYFFTQHALGVQSRLNWNYYMEGLKPRRNTANTISDVLIFISLGLFIVGMLIVSTFIAFGILEIKE